VASTENIGKPPKKLQNVTTNVTTPASDEFTPIGEVRPHSGARKTMRDSEGASAQLLVDHEGGLRPPSEDEATELPDFPRSR
jgi:hypothetical protein